MIDFQCPRCDNHVRINIPDRVDSPLANRAVEAWCCTRHPKPVRMELSDAD